MGFKVQYKEDKHLQNWVKRLISLALVPEDQVQNGLEYIMDIQPDYDLVKFLDYFVETWVENNNYPINMWNHYNTIEDQRTNNHLEGYHNKLNHYMANKKPCIWALITNKL